MYGGFRHAKSLRCASYGSAGFDYVHSQIAGSLINGIGHINSSLLCATVTSVCAYVQVYVLT